MSLIAEIEDQVSRLSTEEQWKLMEHLMRRPRPKASRPDWDADIIAMAADPDIQRELKAINGPEGRRGLSSLFGKFRDDPTLREICEEAYRERAHQ